MKTPSFLLIGFGLFLVVCLFLQIKRRNKEGLESAVEDICPSGTTVSPDQSYCIDNQTKQKAPPQPPHCLGGYIGSDGMCLSSEAPACTGSNCPPPCPDPTGKDCVYATNSQPASTSYPPTSAPYPASPSYPPTSAPYPASTSYPPSTSAQPPASTSPRQLNTNNVLIPPTTNNACPPPPPCPACHRCPEPQYTCKKTPTYRDTKDSIPQPILTDFSAFTN